MFSLQQISRITNIMLVLALLFPLQCLAVMKTKHIEPDGGGGDDGDGRRLQYSSLKHARRLQYTWDDYKPNYNYKSRPSNSNDRVIYVIICLAIFVIALLIRCCMKCAEQSEDEEGTRTVHPPPRTEHHTPNYTSFEPRITTRVFSAEENFNVWITPSSRAVSTRRNVPAPPSSRSRSIIIPSGENISNAPLIVPNQSFSSRVTTTAPLPPRSGSIFRQQDLEDFNPREETPNFNIPTVLTSNLLPRNENSSQLLDMPPSYERVVGTDARRFSEKEFPTVFENNDSGKPPPYDEKR